MYGILRISLIERGIMLAYLLSLTLKDLIRNKTTNILRLSGLVAGLAVIIIILFYVINETSYDEHHKNKDDIYLVSKYLSKHDSHNPSTAYMLGDDIEGFIPQVDEVCRLIHVRSKIKISDSWEQPSRMYWADNNIFEVFTIPFIHGDERTAFSGPNSIIISESAAIKFFSTTECIGEMMQLKVGDNLHELYVSGVMADQPRTSVLRFRYLVSGDAVLNSIGDYYNTIFEKMNYDMFTKMHSTLDLCLTFIKKLPGASIADIVSNLKEIENQQVYSDHSCTFKITPLNELYFESANWTNNIFPAGEERKVGVYRLIALIIALIVCINYVLISIVIDSSKFKEIGIRKLFGARRGDIVVQNTFTGIFLVLLALPFALIVAELLLPFFNQQFQIQIELSWLYSAKYLFIILGSILTIGFITGVCTGLYVSSISPWRLLRKLTTFNSGKKGVLVGLLGLQLFLCTGLLSAAIIINRQSQYYFSKDMGFNKNGLIEVDYPRSMTEKFDVLKNSLLSYPTIIDVSGSSNELLSGNRTVSVMNFEEQPDIKKSVEFMGVDSDYIKTMGINIIEGRDFDSKLSDDEKWSILVNQHMINEFGVEHPVGKRLNDYAMIIGVVGDFHMHSMNEEITNLIIDMGTKHISTLYIRTNPDDIEETLAFLELEWKKILPDSPMNYQLFDDIVNNTYQSELSFNRLIRVLTFVTIIITCTGLWGIAATISNRRRREISIRRVLGASSLDNVVLLGLDYFKYLIVAFIVSIPIMYILMNKWLEQYAYRITIGANDFIMSIVLTAIILLSTIGYSIYRTSTVNPAEVLRSE